jgi:hypothetical protein
MRESSRRLIPNHDGAREAQDQAREPPRSTVSERSDSHPEPNNFDAEDSSRD